jgi:hypothetical protein
MPEMLSSVGSFFGGSGGAGGGLLDLLGLGTSGAGLINNISTGIQENQQISKLKSLENPTNLSKEVAAATQPLNSGLVQSVGNTVDASLAEKGLAQAPGIEATTLSQSLAPFEQQNQQTALQLVLQQLGIPESILGALGKQQTNISPALALLMRQNNPSGGSNPTNPNSSQYDSFFNSLGNFGSSGSPAPADPTFSDSFDFSGVNA